MEVNVNQEELISLAIEKNHDNEKEITTTFIEGQLNFVDLAGSEKISNHHTLLEEFSFSSKKNEDSGYYFDPNNNNNASEYKTMKDRIKESQSINKSLFFLTQVISLKSQDK